MTTRKKRLVWVEKEVELGFLRHTTWQAKDGRYELLVLEKPEGFEWEVEHYTGRGKSECRSEVAFGTEPSLKRAQSMAVLVLRARQKLDRSKHAR